MFMMVGGQIRVDRLFILAKFYVTLCKFNMFRFQYLLLNYKIKVLIKYSHQY